MTEDQVVKPNDLPSPKEYQDTPETRAKIIAQIEYYFSDYNLSRDTFLRGKIKETDEGWVPIDTMIKFNRLRDLCNDGDKILNILSEAAQSTKDTDKKAPFMLTDDSLRIIKRNVDSYPIPEDFEAYLKQLSNHSVYAKGFPKNSTFEDIKAFFVDNYGPVLAVSLRYYNNNQGKKVATQQQNGCSSRRQFKGSVFVTFVESGDADKFLKAPTIKYKGQELVSRMPQHVYETQKKVEYEERQNKQKKGDKNKKDLVEGQNDATLTSRVEELIQKGNIIHIKGLVKTTTTDAAAETTTQNMTRHTLKETFDSYGKVAWIDYEPGQSEAHIRFTGGTEVALQVLNKMAAKLAPKSTDLKDGQSDANDSTKENCWSLSLPGVDGELEARILAGQEELKYWTDVVAHITKAGAGHKQGKRKGNKQFKSFGRKNGRNANSNKRKHNDQTSDEKTNTKIVKT